MLSKVQYKQLLKWEKASRSLNKTDITPEDELLFKSGHIAPSEHEVKDYDDFVLMNHPTVFQITSVGHQAVKEYKSIQREKFNSSLVGFILGILASVIASLILKVFGV